MRALLNEATLRRVVRISAVALIVLTVLGPFGTYEAFSAAGRVAYFSVLLIFCGLIFEITVPSCLSNHRMARRIPRWGRFIIGVLTGSFFATWVVFVVEYVARGPLNPANLPWVFICVATIGFIMSFVSFMPPFAAIATAPNTMDIDFDRIAFFSNYPHLKGSRLRWITMEDHYARVVLDTSEVTLHITMRELEKQLEDYPGLRIHRSHWVAIDAIRNINRNGRTTEIDVGGCTRLPLGGNYRKRAERVFSEIATLHRI